MSSKNDIYLALLRGINVGGKTKVKMAELKACFEKLGYGHVQTYGNSGKLRRFRSGRGNLVFGPRARVEWGAGLLHSLARRDLSAWQLATDTYNGCRRALRPMHG